MFGVRDWAEVHRLFERGGLSRVKIVETGQSSAVI